MKTTARKVRVSWTMQSGVLGADAPRVWSKKVSERSVLDAMADLVRSGACDVVVTPADGDCRGLWQVVS